MAARSSFIDFRLINKSLAERCVAVYPGVLKDVYKETRPKLDQASILGDDTWRFEELPLSVQQAGKLTKEELARLVKWKM